MEYLEEDQIELIDWTECALVEQVPGRMSGVPVIVDTRVTPETVIENFDSGDSIGSIAWNYSLPRVKVRGILEFTGRLAKAVA